MPTISSSDTARLRALAESAISWVSTASAIWSPTLKTGLRAVIGSWKIIEMSFPRTCCICCSESLSRSLPRNLISPLATLAFCSSSRMTVSALTLLPQPDSPTRPTVVPAGMVRFSPRTARTVPPCTRNWTCRSLTSRTVPLF